MNAVFRSHLREVQATFFDERVYQAVHNWDQSQDQDGVDCL